MGQCMTLPIRDIPTHITKLNIQNSSVSFQIPEAQINPQGIKAILIILVDPQNIFYQEVNQAYVGRKIYIDMARFIEQNKITVRKQSKIQFRLAYQYRGFRCQPTSVMPMIYNPGGKLQVNMRLGLQAIESINNSQIHVLNTYKHPQASYYKVKPSYLNILILGSRGIGKSSYVKQISQLLIKKYPHYPRIGNHNNLNVSTTSAFQQYQIIKNSHSLINLIDSPGYRVQQLESFSSNYQYFQKGIVPSSQKSVLFEHKSAIRALIQGKGRSVNDPENYQNIIHSAIVFIDPKSRQSLKVAEQFVKILVEQRVQYITCITGWQEQCSVIEDIYVQKVDQTNFKLVRQNSSLHPMPQRFFMISNVKAANKNAYAINQLLESFKYAVQLAGNFYNHFAPIHILLDWKVIQIRHRIKLDMNLDQFLALIDINQLLKQNRKLKIDSNNKPSNPQSKLIIEVVKQTKQNDAPSPNYFQDLYIQTTYGRKTDKKKGYLLFDTLVQRGLGGTKLQNFITIEEEKYRIFNMVTKIPFLGHKIT